MDDHDRQVLVTLAEAGDHDALHQLLVLHYDAMHAVIARRLGRQWKRYIDPDDVIQDAYVAAFKSVGRLNFRGPAELNKWLNTLALNELNQRIRALKAAKRNVARMVHGMPNQHTSYPDIIAQVGAPEDTPTRLARRNEATAAVLSSLARLSDNQRKVIHLRFLEGKSAAEIAGLLGKTNAAINGLCGHGLRKLRKHLGSITQFLTRL